METKPCITCGRKITKRYTEGRKRWNDHKYCSLSCKPVWNKGLDKSDPRVARYVNGGESTRFNSETTSGDKNIKWKGKDASYAAKHMWVKYHFGSPQECEHCGKTEKRMYHWANISKEYIRERSDWLRLCVPCHKKFDLDRLK